MRGRHGKRTGKNRNHFKGFLSQRAENRKGQVCTMITTKKEILDILEMPEDIWRETVMAQARETQKQAGGNKLTASAMLGYDNICKNQCLYCGMRAGNSGVRRYRMSVEDILQTAQAAETLGLTRLFLVSGEDPKFPFEDILRAVRGAKEKGLWVSLGAGEFSREQYVSLREAGLDEYVMKFEMADREVFNRLNPSTDFDRRMKCIEWIRESGMALASGNIVGYPGQTLEQVADDILLMKELEISWAPVIPYMPAAGTPLAAEGGRGSLLWNLKEISVLRLMMPHIHITAQQPGEDPKEGLTSPSGNQAALLAGADMLFADMLPAAMAKDFRVIDNRMLTQGPEHIRRMAAQAGMDMV